MRDAIFVGTPKASSQTAIQFASEMPGRLQPMEKHEIDERILEQRAWIHELSERVEIFRSCCVSHMNARIPMLSNMRSY